MEILQTIEEWVIHSANQPWVLLVLYGLCVIDGFFPPVPSESIVIALSSVALGGQGQSVWLIIPIAALGAITGDSIAYWIGTKIPLQRIPFLQSGKGKEALDSAERQLSRRGGVYILAARYIPVGRVAVNMTAGAVGFPYRRFLAFDALAGVMWAGYSVLIGTAAGALFENNTLLGIVVGVIGGIAIGLLIDRVMQFFGVAAVELHPPSEAGEDSPDGAVPDGDLPDGAVSGEGEGLDGASPSSELPK